MMATQDTQTNFCYHWKHERAANSILWLVMSAITQNLIGQKARSRNWQLARENWGEASVNPVKKGTGKRLEWDI